MSHNDPLEQLLRAVRSFPAPVLAKVHGSVWGGAFDLVLCCDVVIADETATFAIIPANLGLPYNTIGLLHFHARLPINLTEEMFFTAAPIDAQKAKEWLVLNHLVESAELETVTLDLAATMASKSPLAIAVIKEQLRVLTDYQPIAAQVYERIHRLRREVYDSSDYLEGLEAFAEKRNPIFEGPDSVRQPILPSWVCVACCQTWSRRWSSRCNAGTRLTRSSQRTSPGTLTCGRCRTPTRRCFIGWYIGVWLFEMRLTTSVVKSPFS